MTDLPEAVRHVRRGATYRVRGYATLQSHAVLADGAKMVVYASTEDGSLWVRPASEFMDGRFGAVEMPEEDECVRCEGCRKEIRPGDLCCPDRENGVYMCVDCSPTWADMRAEPEAFRNGLAAGPLRSGEPMTRDEAEAAIADHLASGGALTDKILMRF